MRLGELYATKTPSVDPAAYPDEAFDLFSVPAYGNRVPDLVSGSNIGSSKNLVQPGDVLLCRIVPHIRRAWVVPSQAGRRQIASGEWIVFRDERIWPPYLRQLFLADDFHRQFMTTIAGVGGSLMRARAGHVAAIDISLPPLPEQRRIASILDEADELRANRRAAIEANQALVGGALLQTVRSAGALAPLGDLVRDLRYGTSAKSGSTGMPVLRIPNVSRRELDLGDLKFVDLSAAETERLRLKVGDLLLVRSNGNPDIVGATVRFDPGEDERTFVYASYLIRIRLKESINSTFLAGYLGSELGRAALRRGARTSAGQYNINTQALKALSVPLPDMSMQKAYAESVARIERTTVTMRAHLAKLDELFASLQYRAFRGEL